MAQIDISSIAQKLIDELNVRKDIVEDIIAGVVLLHDEIKAAIGKAEKGTEDGNGSESGGASKEAGQEEQKAESSSGSESPGT